MKAGKLKIEIRNRDDINESYSKTWEIEAGFYSHNDIRNLLCGGDPNNEICIDMIYNPNDPGSD